MSFIYPVDNAISQYFGANPNSYQPNGHLGVDFACPMNTPVRAVGAGTIVWSDWGQKMGANPWMMIPGSDASGILVIVDHGGIFSLYAHLNSTPRNNGERVNAGDVIGYSGTTGRSTGPHLHLEITVKANINNYLYGRTNPLSMMSKTGVVPVGNVTLKANQRMVGPSNLNQRDRPVTNANVVRVVPANTVEEFTGYVVGEQVNTGGVNSNIWYKDDLGYVWSGGFTTQTTSGLTNLTPAPALKPNQRKVGPANANQRAEANSTSKIVRLVQANTIEEFAGFVRGEDIEGNNIWFKDSIGYLWSGLFNDKSTNGLPDLTPAPVPAPSPAPAPDTALKPNQRKVGAAAANQRDSATTGGRIVRIIQPNTIEEFTGFVRGDSIEGNNVWFKDAQGYVWSGLFTDSSTNGLTDQTPSTSEPTPIPPEPSPEKYSFTPDFDFVEYIPAAGRNLMIGNFPEKQTTAVIHQFGTLGIDTVGSTINTFTHPNLDKVASAHFVVSGKRIIQMVSLKDRAYHAGTVGNNYIGIETDPAQDDDTIESTKKLLKALKQKYGRKLDLTLHKNVPGNSTNCGASVILSKYDIEETPNPEPTPTPTPTPTPVPETPSGKTEEQIIDDFLAVVGDHLKEIYFKSK